MIVILGWILATLAIIILLIAALGLLRLPDALSRQHAATKAATLSINLFSLALLITAASLELGWGWIWRLVLIMLILLCTLPLASHALSRASMAERTNPDELMR